MVIKDISYVGRWWNGGDLEVWKIAGKPYLLESYLDGRYEVYPLLDERTIDKSKTSFCVESVMEGVGEPTIVNGEEFYDEYEIVGFRGF